MQPPINTKWVIVTVKDPVIYHQTTDETWLLNPNRRYILNANRLEPLTPHLQSVSEFDSASLCRNLHAGNDICGAKILVERCRERGIGDLLFLTGPLRYLQHLTGNNVEIDVMAFADRGVVLTHSPFINNGCVKCGPVEYDALRHYNYHWFVSSVTEQDSEPDQLNVYDALYRQLGFDYEQIEPRWKRPSVTLVNEDYQSLDMVYRRVWEDKKIELRRVGYYVVAPFSNATLRCLPYGRWLEIIRLLVSRRPVVVIGTSSLRLPDMDMSAGDFIARLASFGQPVINAIDGTSIRAMMALISRATAVVALDSAPLYISQAVNTPAVSLWGTHAPGSRLGYDAQYMQWAIWHDTACRRAPCFAYSHFPVDKCPNGERQQVCEVMQEVLAKEVIAMVDSIEANKAKISTVSNAPASTNDR